MRRCIETRERIVPSLPFSVEPALREVDFGSWEGKTLEWVELYAPEMLAQRQRDPVRFRPPGGESFEDAAERLCALAQTLRTRDDTLVIGHRVTLGILERLLRDLPLDSPLVEGLQPGEFQDRSRVRIAFCDGTTTTSGTSVTGSYQMVTGNLTLH